MQYTEHYARRVLARRLFEAEFLGKGSWHGLAEPIRRMYERDIEKLLDPRNEEVCDALRAIGFDVGS